MIKMESKIFLVLICHQILILSLKVIQVIGDNVNDTGSLVDCHQNSVLVDCKSEKTGQTCKYEGKWQCKCPDVLVNITDVSWDGYTIPNENMEKSNHIWHSGKGKCILRKNWLCPFANWTDHERDGYFGPVTCEDGMKCVNGSSVFPILNKLKENTKFGVCGAKKNAIGVGAFMIIIIHYICNLK